MTDVVHLLLPEGTVFEGKIAYFAEAGRFSEWILVESNHPQLHPGMKVNGLWRRYSYSVAGQGTLKASIEARTLHLEGQLKVRKLHGYLQVVPA